MQTACCDTSFLYSLYGQDTHTPTALLELSRFQGLLLVTSLNTFELGNALRFAECRKGLLPGKAAAFLGDLQRDMAMGKMVFARWCNLPMVLAEADRLSSRHTLTSGHRAFDILHVAAARHLQADVFLSFDVNQCALANAEGLIVRP